jgi:hypothetical protein
MGSRQVFYTPIKRNHLIAPFGVGALLLARNGVGVIVCGLDEWLRERPSDGRDGASWLDKNQLVDPHLQRRLRVNRLVQPPAIADDPDERNTWFVRVARFPLTEYCINPKCRRVAVRGAEGVSQGRCLECDESGSSRKRSWPTQQTPLVLACPHGHLSDVPWSDWVHDPELRARDDQETPRQPGGTCARPELTYRVATDVTAPVVGCETCGAGIDLGTVRHRQFDCPGQRPWLPGTAPELCVHPASVLERTSTALYYPEVRSALHLPHGPDVDHRLMALLDEPVAQVLLNEYEAGEHPDERDLARLVRIAASRGIATTADEVDRHVGIAIADHEDDHQDVDVDVDDNDDVVRSRELSALLDAGDKTASPIGLPTLIVETRCLGDYKGPQIADHFSAICAVPRLAETRVLTGFARVEPRQVPPLEGFAQMWGFLLDTAKERDWLVAHRVYGEGILLLLEPVAVASWVAATRSSSAWYALGDDQQESPVEPRRVLAHTLAHVLLREAAAVCGYSLPSLRERLYVTPDGWPTPQTGILLFTAEGDAYGTLGGLVELADPGNLEGLLARAIEHARWCGGDPVCMNPPRAASLQTTPGCCHHCMLLPETSCEMFNQGLDRAALVGGRHDVPGYFA